METSQPNDTGSAMGAAAGNPRKDWVTVTAPDGTVHQFRPDITKDEILSYMHEIATAPVPTVGAGEYEDPFKGSFGIMQRYGRKAIASVLGGTKSLLTSRTRDVQPPLDLSHVTDTTPLDQATFDPSKEPSHPFFGQTVSDIADKYLMDDVEFRKWFTQLMGPEVAPADPSGRILEAASGPGPVAQVGGALGQGAIELGVDPELVGATEMLVGAGSGAAVKGAEHAVETGGRKLVKRLIAGGGEAGQAQRIIGEYTQGFTDGEISTARELVARKAAEGTAVTFPEALASVAPSKAQQARALQRFVEETGTNNALTQAMDARAATNRNALEDQLARIGGPSYTEPRAKPQGFEASDVPYNAQQAAAASVESAKTARTRATEDLFNAPQGPPNVDLEGLNTMLSGNRAYAQAFRKAAESANIEGRQLPQWLRTVGEGDNMQITGVVTAPDVQAAHEISSALGSMIEEARTAGDRTRVRSLTIAKDRYDSLMDEGIPGYRDARARFEDVSQRFVEPHMRSPTGQLANAPASTLAQRKIIMKLGEQGNLDPQSIRNLVRDMNEQNPVAASQWAQDNLQSLFDEATQALKSMPENQQGGAGYYNLIMGNRAQADNLQALISSLPDGERKWAGFANLMETFRIQGNRLVPGASSPTTYNQMFRDRFSQGPSVGKTVQAIADVGTGGATALARKAIGTGMSAADETAALKRVSPRANTIGGLLMDPASADTWGRLAQMSPYSPGAARILKDMLGGAAIGGGLPMLQTEHPAGEDISNWLPWERHQGAR